MTSLLYYIFCGVLSLAILFGIKLMSNVKTAKIGNLISSFATLFAIAITLYQYKILTDYIVWIGIIIGTIIGIIISVRVKMIGMPQTVAVLNGFGGIASMLAAFVALMNFGDLNSVQGKYFEIISGSIALIIGGLTFSGSMVAAAKLKGLISQKPIKLVAHQLWVILALIIMVVPIVLIPILTAPLYTIIFSVVAIVFSLVFGILFAIRIGGADMPITISLLNSTSGLAAAIAGMAVNDILLVAVGGIVGASGLLLTQIMCRSMNRSLFAILVGAGLQSSKTKVAPVSAVVKEKSNEVGATESDLALWFKEAKNVIIIPGYGMALSQAQLEVKSIADKLEGRGAKVRFAIHPVAGRMPGHMNVLLAEVDISYDNLFELSAINDDFKDADLVLVVGANDVINPAANSAVGTPIYGMPVLNAQKAKHIVICNFDSKPGYAGVPNPLYEPAKNICLLLGDAKESLAKIMNFVD